MKTRKFISVLLIMLICAGLIFASGAQSLYNDFETAVQNGDVSGAIEAYNSLNDQIAKEKENIQKDIEKANKIAEDAKNIFKESMPYFEKAVELNPENADYLKTLRSLYYRFYDDDPKYPELYNKVNEQLKSL